MRIRILLPALVVLLAPPLSAQVPGIQPPNPEQMERMREVAQTMMNPAAMALSRRSEIGLTDVQVAALQPVAEQMRGAVERMMMPGPSPVQSQLGRAMSDPSVEIDQAALHAELCERAAVQAAYMVEMVRAQRAVHAALTPEQRARLQTMQMNMGMQMMQGMTGAAGGVPR